ncbi:MAG: hypothetical protein HY361_03420 [Candidatus Aenigmarchaeota archaeon]|nr:hypothetical protein [Candidatus Aenigmarchaeota archaeon]
MIHQAYAYKIVDILREYRFAGKAVTTGRLKFCIGFYCPEGGYDVLMQQMGSLGLTREKNRTGVNFKCDGTMLHVENPASRLSNIRATNYRPIVLYLDERYSDIYEMFGRDNK